MSNAKRTIVLWVVLLALFFLFYGIFSKPGEGGAAPNEGGSSSAGWTVVVQWIPSVVFFGGVFGFVWYQRRKYAPLHEGARLCNQGRYAQALEHFEKYRRAHPRDAIGAYNVGAMKLMLWRLDEARRDLEAARDLAKGKVALLTTLLPENLAITHALLGNGDQAQRLLAELSPEKSDPGIAGLAMAILAARAGDWARARTGLGSFEVKQMSGTGALVRTLDAFCIEQLTQEKRHVDRVALGGESSLGELKKYWPQLVEFVERAPAW